MNAFNRFSPPDSDRHTDWLEAVSSHCQSLEGSETAPQAVDAVLEQVQAAVNSGRVRFEKGNVAQAVDFVNGLMEAVRRVVPGTSAWTFQKMVPPSVALFVQPEDETRFGFQPMFTL